ncbi:MAG: sigma-70 family RNA polymerase sigma factor [Akkermansiaceae bacterium]|jgi:RNA polymerase sigma-70 factor (ECF subfamily)
MATDLTFPESLGEVLPPLASGDSLPKATLEEGLEKRWLEAAQRGDHEAFTRLVEAHQDRIYSLCLRLLSSPEDAAEACQDTFVRAFHALPGFRPHARFSTWLYRIAVNRCHDFWKRASSRLKSRSASLTGTALQLAAHEQSPDDRADWNDSLQELDRALRALPARDREIIILVGVENLSHAECAAILKTTPRGVEGRLYRAREKLRQIWRGPVPNFPFFFRGEAS